MTVQCLNSLKRLREGVAFVVTSVVRYLQLQLTECLLPTAALVSQPDDRLGSMWAV